MMRKYLFATAACVLIATPAIAKDNSGYVGIDVGAVWPKSQDVFGAVDFTNTAVADLPNQDVGTIKYKTGIDADLIGGYDFGMFRIEGELGYKHGKVKHHEFDYAFLSAISGR